MQAQSLLNRTQHFPSVIRRFCLFLSCATKYKQKMFTLLRNKSAKFREQSNTATLQQKVVFIQKRYIMLTKHMFFFLLFLVKK